MITKDNNFRVMKLFFDSPEKKIHIREIARLTNLSPSGVLKIVRKLKMEGLLISEKGKILENVRARKTDKFIEIKRLYNIHFLFDSGLVGFLRDKYEEPECIMVFGSYSKGEDISKSDIDIAVVTKMEMQINLVNFENMLKRKINIHEIEIAECSKEFLNNLANGIVLYGHLKVL